MVKFKDFSRPLSVFQVLFKANLIFKDFSRQSCIFKYFSSLCEPLLNGLKKLVHQRQMGGHTIFLSLLSTVLGGKSADFCQSLSAYICAKIFN